MYQYYIQLKNSLGDYKFEQREGYQLPDSFAACQEGGKWIISDVLSGAKVVQDAIILNDAKAELAKIMPKIKEIRSRATYKKATERLAEFVKSLPEEKRCQGWKRYFRVK